MKITIENGKETVINLSGQLDTLTSVDLEKEIAPILQGEAQTVVLDGAELTYISSAGLRLLLTLQKGMKNKGGSFRLKNIQNEIMEILNITGLAGPETRIDGLAVSAHSLYVAYLSSAGIKILVIRS